MIKIQKLAEAYEKTKDIQLSKHMQSQYQLAQYASYHIHLQDYQPQVRRILQGV